MKIQSRIVLILISGLAVCVALSVVFKQVVNNKRKNLLIKQAEDTKNITVPNAFDVNSSDLRNYSNDYSVWDQLVDFIYSQDSAWAKEELEISLFNHPIDYIWVLNTDAQSIYYKAKDPECKSNVFNVSADKLKDKLAFSRFQHFYFRFNNQVVEVYTAPVQPTNDTERKTAPHGYLMLGKVVNDEYIANLSQIAPEITFGLFDTNEPLTESIDSKNSVFNYSIPLNSVDNTPVGIISISRTFPALSNFSASLNNYLLGFIILVGMFCALFYYLLRGVVIKPIASISRALHTKDGSGIKGLSQSKTEYGELCTLIIDSFSQNAQLAHEIEIRKNSENALQTALQEKKAAIAEKIRAEESALAKSQFLSTMSHEIRTPINGVIGIANLLMEEKLTHKQMEYVSTLNFSAQHLLTLVSDILDFSKIEAGSLHFEKVSFNLEKLCRNTFDLFGNKAAEKNLDYTFIPDPVKDYSLYGDSTRLNQVIANLLSNAIKFTEKGGVEFSYKVLENNNHKSTIRFTVKDTGIGIPPEKIGKVFESFAQADDSVTRRYGGTGLGLTISKKIVELQGGNIKVESIPGKGSSFMFTITFDNHVYEDKALYEKNIENTARKELPGMRILVAEDNPINAMVLTRFLTKWKIESKVAVDGAEAVSMINNEEYDMILMDLQMPNVDGVEATRLIRMSEADKVKAVPIIAFTADALVDTHRSLMKNGFNHCITKPFNPEQLFKYLQQHYAKAS